MLFITTISSCFATCSFTSPSGMSCLGGSFTVPNSGWGQQVVDFGTVEG